MRVRRESEWRHSCEKANAKSPMWLIHSLARDCCNLFPSVYIFVYSVSLLTCFSPLRVSTLNSCIVYLLFVLCALILFFVFCDLSIFHVILNTAFKDTYHFDPEELMKVPQILHAERCRKLGLDVADFL